MKTVKCKLCGEIDKLHWNQKTIDLLVSKQMCFGCNFWDEYIATKDDPTHIIVEHNHYVIADENITGMRGFGGSRFIFKRLSDGKMFTSTNVWNQGDIPKHFWEQLPDNAEMLPYGTPFEGLPTLEQLLTAESN